MIETDQPAIPDPDSSVPKDRQVREMFGRIARTYDLLNRILSFGMDQHWRRYAIHSIGLSSPPGVETTGLRNAKPPEGVEVRDPTSVARIVRRTSQLVA